MEKQSLRELINPTPKQDQFLQALFNPLLKYLGYGGAKGGGKSYLLRWALIVLMLEWAMRGFKNVRTGLFCEDYPTLTDRQITKIETEFPKWLGVLISTRTDGLHFKLKEKYGGGKLLLRNLDDPSKYDGSEMAAVAVDQLEKNPLKTFQTLRGILRWPSLDDVKFLASFNPGGMGSEFVKGFFVTGEMLLKSPVDGKPDPEKDRFYFLQAKVQDNPYNPVSYVDQLMSLPIALRRAYLDGDWDVFEGQFFDKLNRSIHHIEDSLIPSYSKLHGAMDYGNYAVCYFGKFDNKGTGYITHEWVSEEGQLDEKALSFKNFCYYHGFRDFTVVGDTDMFAEPRKAYGGNEKKVADIFKKVCNEPTKDKNGNTIPGLNINFVVVSKTQQENKTYRVWCNRQLLNKLAWEQDRNGLWIKKPKLYINHRCKKFWDTVPKLVVSKIEAEDIDQEQGIDHPYDAAKMWATTYGKVAEPNKDNRKELEEQIKEQFKRNI